MDKPFDFETCRVLVRGLLESAPNCWQSWSTQLFGMLRLYLEHGYRLHVWDSRIAKQGVSNVHTHPWELCSLVISGELRNTRYVEREDGELFYGSSIQPGKGGGLRGNPMIYALHAKPVEVLTPGSEYRQTPEEVHSTGYVDGTVTLAKRVVLPGADPDRALTFWPVDSRWISAEPRASTEGEVRDITRYALSAMGK